MLPNQLDKTLIRERVKESVENGFLKHKTVIIFGCTIYAKEIRNALQDYGIQISAFIDNNKEKVGKDCIGIRIYSPEYYLIPYKMNMVVIICSKYNHEMTEQIKEMGYSSANILDIPVMESQNKADDSIYAFKMEVEHIEEGYVLYQKLCEKYSTEFFFYICPYPGTGDIYMACSYLLEYLLKRNIRNFVLLVTRNSCKKIADLFEISHIKVISPDKVQYILKAWEFLGSRKMKVKPLLYWGWRTKRYLYADKYPQITFTEMFLYDVYGLEDRTKRQLPAKKNNSWFAYQLFQQLNLPKGKTVIIAPYAGSFESDITMEQWEKLSNKLMQEGYAVCTNCAGKGEIPIPGTIAIIFPYDEAINVLEYAGGFIAVRSGLCDIVSSAKCRMTIIYENGFNASRYEFFSLKKMGLNTNAIEKIYTSENSILELADEWGELKNDRMGV